MSGDKTAGQWAGTIIGGTVGFLVGGPQGAYVGASIGAGVGGYIDPPQGPAVEGPRLDDLSVQTARYGEPIGRGHGRIGIHGSVIWINNNQLTEVVTKKKQSGGKGGGGSSTEVTTYSYFATFAVALLDTPPEGVRAIGRVWVGPNLIYNGDATDYQTVFASHQAYPYSGFGLDVGLSDVDTITGQDGVKFILYPGTDDQEPNPLMQADLGAANTPAFRGTSYIVFDNLPLEKYGNSLLGAQVKIELIVGDIETGLLYMEAHESAGQSQNNNNAGCSCLMNASGVATCLNSRTDAKGNTKLRKDTIYADGSVVSDVVVNVAKIVVSGWSRDGTTAYIHDGNTVMVNGVQFSYDNTMAQPLVLKYGDTVVLHEVYGGSVVLHVYTPSGGDPYVSSSMGSYYGWAIMDEDTLVAIHESGNQLATFSTATLAQIDTFALSPSFPQAGGENDTIIQDTITFCACVDNGIYYAFSAELLQLLLIYDIVNGVEIDRREVPTSWSGNTRTRIDVGYGVFSIYSRGSVDPPPTIHRFKLNDFSEASVPLSDVVETELLRSGYIDSSDLDLSDLDDDSVRGYRIAGIQQIRAAINPLMGAWPFDLIMSGYQIKAVRRGQSAVATFTADDLDARAYGSEPGAAIDETREMDSQLPRQVILKYIDAEREYDNNQQPSVQRLSSNARDTRDITVPIVFTGDEAAQRADLFFNLAWQDRVSRSFNLPPTALALEPADVINLTTDYASYVMRLSEVNYLPDGRVECRGAKSESPAVYTQTDSIGGVGTTPSETIGVASPTLAILLDIPLIRNQDNEPLFALAMAGYTSTWAGAVMYKSNDNEQTWEPVQASNSPATIGRADGSLDADDGYVIDRDSELIVNLTAGELESVTEAQMMMGFNWAAYGDDQRWELLRFANADLNSDGSYTISTLLRGLRGTVQYTGEHDDNDWFVLLEDPDVYGIGADLQFLNAVRHWRPVTRGRTVDTTSSTTFAYRGVNLKPLSGVHGELELQVSGTWNLTWDVMSRLYGSVWTTGVEVPSGEATSTFEIDVMDGSEVVNTYGASSPGVWAYTEANQIDDFGAAQSSITVRVYQMSADVGRGYPMEVTG